MNKKENYIPPYHFVVETKMNDSKGNEGEWTISNEYKLKKIIYQQDTKGNKISDGFGGFERISSYVYKYGIFKTFDQILEAELKTKKALKKDNYQFRIKTIANDSITDWFNHKKQICVYCGRKHFNGSNFHWMINKKTLEFGDIIDDCFNNNKLEDWSYDVSKYRWEDKVNKEINSLVELFSKDKASQEQFYWWIDSNSRYFVVKKDGTHMQIFNDGEEEFLEIYKKDYFILDNVYDTKSIIIEKLPDLVNKQEITEQKHKQLQLFM